MSVVTNRQSVTRGDFVDVGVRISLQKGWYTYWKNPGEVGIPTRLSLEEASSQKVSLQVPLQERETIYPVPRKKEIHGLISYIYDGDFILVKRILVPKDEQRDSLEIPIRLQWAICKKTCIPLETHLKTTLPVGPKSIPSQEETILKKAVEASPKGLNGPSPWTLKTSYPKKNGDPRLLVLRLSSPEAVDYSKKSLEVFIENPPPLFDYHSLFIENDPKDPKSLLITLGLPKTQEEPLRWVVTSSPPFKAYVFSYDPQKDAPLMGTTAPHFLYFFLVALLGGILLNFMPCVFPVLSIKALSLIKDSKKKSVADDVLFFLGIFMVFSTFFLILWFFKDAAQSLGWGFNFQSPAFVGFLSLFFLILSLNLLGIFEIPPIGVGQTLLQTLLRRTSSFAYGIVTSLSSSACVVPFMGVSVASILTQSFAVNLGVFTGLSLGFAAPLLLLKHLPRLQTILPKSASFTIPLKQLLSLPLLFTSLWFLSIWDTLLDHKRLMPLLFCLLFWGIGGFFWGKRQILSASFQKRFFTVLGVLSIALGVFFYGFYGVSTAAPKGGEAEIRWQTFSPPLVERLNREKKSFLIVFTADWCLNCIVLDDLLFSSEKVLKTLRQESIVLVKADWTKDDPTITKAVHRYGRMGIPLYVLYRGGRPLVLPEFMSPSQFIHFLSQKGALNL